MGIGPMTSMGGTSNFGYRIDRLSLAGTTWGYDAMSAIGPKRTVAPHMSASRTKADMLSCTANVCF
jgi:hypothetical protein